MNLHLIEYSISKEILETKSLESAYKNQHIGTHLDCYNLSKIELPKEISVKVIDVRGLEIIDVDIVKNIEGLKDSFVIFRTGYLEKFGYGSSEYLNPNKEPYLTNQLVDYLLDNKVRLIGIDFKGIQHGENHKKIDQYVESKGAYIIENICNLDKVKDSFDVSLNWLQFDGATAIKVEIETI
ncbi:MAG: cyclase family protein [Sarcina sp.]